MGRLRDPVVRQRWRELMRVFELSGLTVARFCEQHGVSTAPFYVWRQKLREPAATNGKASGRGHYAAGRGPTNRVGAGVGDFERVSFEAVGERFRVRCSERAVVETQMTDISHTEKIGEARGYLRNQSARSGAITGQRRVADRQQSERTVNASGGDWPEELAVHRQRCGGLSRGRPDEPCQQCSPQRSGRVGVRQGRARQVVVGPHRLRISASGRLEAVTPGIHPHVSRRRTTPNSRPTRPYTA